MKQPTLSVRRLAEGGLIAALYAALTLAVPPLSYGLAQFRVSEMLTVLPLFTPAAVPGLAVGCVVSNLAGFAMGANLAGAWDILFGSLATLAAAALTYSLRNIRWFRLPVAATLPPVLLNAAVVGLELDIMLFGFSWKGYAAAAAYVAAGELLACTAGGLLLYWALTRTGAARAVFGSAAR